MSYMGKSIGIVELTAGILLAGLSVFLGYLVANSDVFATLTGSLRGGTLPPIKMIPPILLNVVRVFLLFGSGYSLLRSSYRAKQICIFAIIVEGLSIGLYFTFFEPQKGTLWTIAMFTPAVALFVALLSGSRERLAEITARFYGRPAQGRGKTGGSITFTVHNEFDEEPIDPGPNPLDEYRYPVNETYPGGIENLRTMIIIMILLIGAGSALYIYKDSLLSELHFFVTKTHFLSDSGIERFLEKLTKINQNIKSPEKKATIEKPSATTGISKTLIKKPRQRLTMIDRKSTQLRKNFANRVHSRKALKKKVSHYETAHAFLSRKNYSRAVTEFKESLHEPLPKYTKMLAHYFLAKTYESKLKSPRKALRHWIFLKNMGPHRVKHQLNLPEIAVKEVKRLKRKLKLSTVRPG